jgi:pimeloyl-ACP methyl ester carboxylesterase
MEELSVAYANNQGTRIYYETEGSGPPLVLHHGSFGSGEDWREYGYAEALKPDHQLILIDARGHGASDKPHDPAAYDLASRVGDVTAVLDDLQIQQAHFLGYSMGGWIGFGCAQYAPERFRSLILGGAHPYAETMQSFRDGLASGLDGFDAWARQVFGDSLTPAKLTRLRANDLVALTALSQDRADFSDVLPAMQMPCLLYVGEDDPRLAQMRDCVNQLDNVVFFSIPSCNHIQAMVRSHLVLPPVSAFLAKLN